MPGSPLRVRDWTSITAIEVSERKLTSLDDIGFDVLENSIDLFLHKIDRDMMNIVDPQRILRSQCGGGRHGIAAMSRQDFLISLKTPRLRLS